MSYIDDLRNFLNGGVKQVTNVVNQDVIKPVSTFGQNLAKSFTPQQIVSPLPQRQPIQIQGPSFMTQLGQSPIGQGAVGLQKFGAGVQTQVAQPLVTGFTKFFNDYSPVLHDQINKAYKGEVGLGWDGGQNASLLQKASQGVGNTIPFLPAAELAGGLVGNGLKLTGLAAPTSWLGRGALGVGTSSLTGGILGAFQPAKTGDDRANNIVNSAISFAPYGLGAAAPGGKLVQGAVGATIGAGQSLATDLLTGKKLDLPSAITNGLVSGVLSSLGSTEDVTKSSKVDKYFRDNQGQFAGEKVQTASQIKKAFFDRAREVLGKGPDEPIYPSDLKKLISDQRGFINFGADVGGKNTGQERITDIAKGQKTFNPNQKLDDNLYKIFNDEYQKVQDVLGIDSDLKVNLPKEITGKEALSKLDLPIAGVGQEGALNIAEKLKSEGYQLQSSLPQQTKESSINFGKDLGGTSKTKGKLNLQQAVEPSANSEMASSSSPDVFDPNNAGITRQGRQVMQKKQLDTAFLKGQQDVNPLNPESNPKIELQPNRTEPTSNIPSQSQSSEAIIPQTPTNRLKVAVENQAEKTAINQADAAVAKDIRSSFSKGQIDLINNFKRILNSRAFQEGDIETLRKQGKSKIINDGLQAIMESRPDITTEQQAIEFAQKFPSQKVTTVKKVALTPEEKTLRIQALHEQQAFEQDFGKHATPQEQEKMISDWEAQVKKETVSQNQLNTSNERTFKLKDKQATSEIGGTKAFKGGKNPELTGNFPARSLSSKTVNDKAPFLYQRETLLRNIEDTFKNPNESQAIKKYFHDPIVKNETENTQFKNQLRTQLSSTFKELGINRGSSEDYAAANFIEGKVSRDELIKQFGSDKANNIIKASEQGRTVYKDLLGKINAELQKFGYDPIPERQNYVTHTAQIQTLMDQFGNMLNFSKEKLPTEMSAINVDTKPGKEFFRYALKRQGGSTHKGLIDSLDKYIDPAGNQIFHTADIQRGRALLDYLNKSNTGSQNTTLSNFNSYLGQYVDSLAGKKSIIDRPFEKVLGRGVLNAVNWLKKRTGANMVGGNISSAITNFIPFTQSIATTSKPSVVKGLYESVLSPAKGINNIDGVESSFLTRRFPKEQIGSTLGSTAKDAAGFLFKTVDAFTAKSIVAGKYFEGVSKGLDKNQAMAQADEYAARVLADRSAGQMPLLFNSKVLGAFTQFQLEVNNQASFLMKDIPKNSGYNKTQIASSLAQFVLYSYLFNNLFQKVTGRRPQIDVLDAALKTYSNISQAKPLKDTLDPTNQNTPVGEIAQNLPFVSTLTGGRIPIGAALPDVPGLMKGTTSLGKEAIKPLTYIVPPLGGGQIKKTIEGLGAFNKGASTTPKGQVRFPIKKDIPNLLRTGLFGQYATPESEQYFNSNANPLSENQSKAFFNSTNPEGTYNSLIQNRENNKKVNEAKKNGSSSSIDNKLITNDGKTIDLNPPTKGQGIDAFTNQNWNVTKAIEVWKYKDKLSPDQVSQTFNKLGVDPQDVRYAYLASHNTDVSTQYIKSKSPDHQTLLKNLVSGRVVGINGQQFASDAVISSLNKEGLLSDSEAKSLRAMKVDKSGKSLAKVAGRKAKKIKFGSIRLPKIKMSKIKTSSLKARSVKAPAIKHLTYKKSPIKLK